MRNSATWLGAVLVWIGLVTGGVASVTETAEYRAVVSALGAGLPDVAARKCRGMLEVEGLGGEDRKVLRSLYVEALVRAGEVEKAVAFSRGGESSGLREDYWKGVALAGVGRLREALGVFAVVAESEGELAELAAHAQADVLVRLGDVDGARGVMESILEKGEGEGQRLLLRLVEMELAAGEVEAAVRRLGGRVVQTAEGRYVAGRVAMAEGEFKRAEVLFEGGLEEGLERGERLDAALRIGRAAARVAGGDVGEGLQGLVGLIEGRPTSAFLGLAFARLEQHGGYGDENVRGRLEVWAVEEGERGVQAMFYLAMGKMGSGQEAEGIAILKAFLEKHGEHALARRAGFALARYLVGEGEVDEALGVLGGVALAGGRDGLEKDFLVGLALARQGEYGKAKEAFGRAAGGEIDAANREAAGVNAALAALLAGDEKAFEEQCLVLSEGNGLEVGESEVGVQLKLERALHLASKRDAGAVEALERMVELLEGDRRAADVELALAEMRLLEFPPRVKAAREGIEKARKIAGGEPAFAARVDYVLLWIEEADGNSGGVVRQAKAFLERWPKSELAPDVRLKLAQVYYRRQDFPNALTEFELFAENYPESALADTALFFAGKASMSLLNPEGMDRAIDVFGRVIEKGGELAPVARYYQAEVKKRLGNYGEALAVLDQVLEGDAEGVDGELRADVALLKAETLLAMHSKEEPRADEARAVIAGLLKDPKLSLTAYLRGQYLVAKGYELEGNQAGCLEACFDAIDPSNKRVEKVDDPGEIEWYFRIGFVAMDVLEANERWHAAVAVADRLAGMKGRRAQDAKARAEKIRLERFVWEKK